MSDYKYQRIITKEGEPTIVKVVYVPDEVVKQIKADAIDEFAKAIICELKNKHTDMPIVDILGSREKWKEKNSQYLECENLAYKIAEELKAGGKNE